MTSNAAAIRPNRRNRPRVHNRGSKANRARIKASRASSRTASASKPKLLKKIVPGGSPRAFFAMREELKSVDGRRRCDHADDMRMALANIEDAGFVLREQRPWIGAVQMKCTLVQQLVPHAFQGERPYPVAFIPQHCHHLAEDDQPQVFAAGGLLGVRE